MIEETHQKKKKKKRERESEKITGIAAIRNIIECLYQFICCTRGDGKELGSYIPCWILILIQLSVSLLLKLLFFFIDIQLGFSCKLSNVNKHLPTRKGFLLGLIQS